MQDILIAETTMAALPALLLALVLYTAKSYLRSNKPFRIGWISSFSLALALSFADLIAHHSSGCAYLRGDCYTAAYEMWRDLSYIAAAYYAGWVLTATGYVLFSISSQARTWLKRKNRKV